MGNNCCGPKKPAGAEHQIASFVFGGTGGACGCSHPYTFKKNFCWAFGPCGRAPDHPGWLAAEPEMNILFGEVAEIVRLSPKCCGCGVSYDQVASQLRSGGWLDRANAALGVHGLVCDLHSFTTVVSNGNNTQVQQHLHLRVFELNDATREMYKPTGSALAGGSDGVKTGPNSARTVTASG